MPYECGRGMKGGWGAWWHGGCSVGLCVLWIRGALETHFFGGVGGWGVQNVEKTPTPLFGSTIMNLLVCFDSEPEKVFSGALLGT